MQTLDKALTELLQNNLKLLQALDLAVDKMLDQQNAMAGLVEHGEEIKKTLEKLATYDKTGDIRHTLNKNSKAQHLINHLKGDEKLSN